MAGNSDECRAHGAHCIELAANTESLNLRKELLILAAKWNHLAVYLEGHTPDPAAPDDGLPSPPPLQES